MSLARAHPTAIALAGLGMVLAACGGGPSQDGTPPPSTPPPFRATPTAVATLEPRSVTFGERATFYGADPDDHVSSMAAGDFNGDGALDLALASPQADGPDNDRPSVGEVYIFLGPFSPGEARDAAAGQQDVTVYGTDAGDEAGRALTAGDLNGDGIDDLVIGVPFADGPEGTRPDAGATNVLLGSPDLPQTIDLPSGADVTVHGAGPDDLSGFALATADVSGDGINDLIVSSFWAGGPDDAREQAGEVYVVFGARAPPRELDLAAGDQDVTVHGAQAGDKLGEAVSAGDVTGDGVADLVLPAPFADQAAGRTYVIAGGPTLPALVDLTAELTLPSVLGLGEGDQAGHSAAVADVDGDGSGDLLLGAVSADGPDDLRDLSGEAYLVRARELTTGTVGAASGASVRFHGAAAADRLGRAVALGDLNGDRLPDVLLIATGSDGPESSGDAGQLYVFFGPLAGADVVDLASVDPDLSLFGKDAADTLGNGTFGRPALTAADMDGDGLDDALVSAPRGDGPGEDRPDTGEAYIVFLREQ